MAATGDDYGHDLGRRFANRYADWRANNRSPQTRAEYYQYLNDSQTHVCTKLAAEHYNEAHDVVLKELVPVDSHAFSCGWVNARDDRLCFHVNFKADAGRHGTRFFFAEILGDGPPQRVQNCVMLGGPSSCSTTNCSPCSGISHPTASGSFEFGHEWRTSFLFDKLVMSLLA